MITLAEDEKRRGFQLEGFSRYDAIQVIAVLCRYTRDYDQKDTAKNLLNKYADKVTDVCKDVVVYIRLSNGVNAVDYSCYDYRTLGKKDDVSFAVMRLDEARGVAVEIIYRI